MPPVVIDMMQSWRADLLRGDAAMQQEMAQQWLGVEQALQAQVDALALELQGGGRVTMGHLQRSRRYQQLMGQVDDELGKYARFVEGRVENRQQALLNAAISHSQAAINAVATEAEILAQFNRLPVSAVENMVGLTGAGTPVRDILADASRVGPEALRQRLVDGIALGWNPLRTARDALRNGLAQSFTRMATIARTETLRVYRQTTLESYRQSNVVVGYRRLAAKDERTCLGCLMADGRQYTLDQPFDAHPNCVIEGTIVSSSPITGSTKRFYNGPVCHIITVGGNHLAVTPNHPVLTEKGWVAAHLLKVGDNVISGRGDNWSAVLIDPDNQQGPARIEDVVAAFCESGKMRTVSVPVTAVDFHGDGIGSQICIVGSNRFLQNQRQSTFLYPFGQQAFNIGNMGLGALPSDSSVAQSFKSFSAAADMILGDFDSAQMFFFGSLHGQQPISFGDIAKGYAGIKQPFTDRSSRSLMPGGKNIFGFTGEIVVDDAIDRQVYESIVAINSFFAQPSVESGPSNFVLGYDVAGIDASNVVVDCIVDCYVTEFSGHVYNLQTETGWYVAEGIITHNCRCAAIPVLRNTPPVQFETGQEWFRRQPESVQRNMLGPSRWDLYRRGEVGLDDLVTRQWDDTWGGALVPAPVRSLPGGAGALQRMGLAAQARVVENAERKIYKIRTHEEMAVVDARGRRVLYKKGGTDEVAFTADEARLFDGCVVTHNHPLTADGSSFSSADVMIAATYKPAELRAVGGKYLHRLRLDRDLEWNKDIKPVYDKVDAQVRNDFWQAIDRKEMSTEDAALNHKHEVWTRVGAKIGDGWWYERTIHGY